MVGPVKETLFCLGNSISAVTCFNIFVIPALKKMMGHPNPQPMIVKAKVSQTITLSLASTTLWVLLSLLKITVLVITSNKLLQYKVTKTFLST